MPTNFYWWDLVLYLYFNSSKLHVHVASPAIQYTCTCTSKSCFTSVSTFTCVNRDCFVCFTVRFECTRLRECLSRRRNGWRWSIIDSSQEEKRETMKRHCYQRYCTCTLVPCYYVVNMCLCALLLRYYKMKWSHFSWIETGAVDDWDVRPAVPVWAAAGGEGGAYHF